MCAQSLSCVQLFATPWTIAAMLLCQWDFSGKYTGVGCHALLQGIFPTQGSTYVSCIGRQIFTTEPPENLCILASICIAVLYFISLE